MDVCVYEMAGNLIWCVGGYTSFVLGSPSSIWIYSSAVWRTDRIRTHYVNPGQATWFQSVSSIGPEIVKTNQSCVAWSRRRVRRSSLHLKRKMTGLYLKKRYEFLSAVRHHYSDQCFWLADDPGVVQLSVLSRMSWRYRVSRLGSVTLDLLAADLWVVSGDDPNDDRQAQMTQIYYLASLMGHAGIRGVTSVTPANCSTHQGWGFRLAASQMGAFNR